MNVEAHGKNRRAQDGADGAVYSIAAAIGEPARARMLYRLLDGQARTSTELAVLAGVGASTASAHLGRLRAEKLVKLLAQGKHRYYSLAGREVAAALEALSVLATGPGKILLPNAPSELRAARTCYDHIAGRLGVSLHDALGARGWLTGDPSDGGAYELTAAGSKAFEALGIDVAAARALRRRFAYACVDWSERRPHLAGAAGAALLNVALKRRWLIRDPDSRALRVTKSGRRELQSRFGIRVCEREVE